MQNEGIPEYMRELAAKYARELFWEDHPELDQGAFARLGVAEPPFCFAERSGGGARTDALTG